MQVGSLKLEPLPMVLAKGLPGTYSGGRAPSFYDGHWCLAILHDEPAWILNAKVRS